MLAESEQAIASIVGKDIISFYGVTGAGKSTSVNHFLRIPLEVDTINGRQVVKIK
jgi:putative ribosome biogenesis GTPase RsgA